MAKHTRKRKTGTMTIPQLRKAFDHMESRTSDILRRYPDKKERRSAFQEEWKKVFHRDVDDKAADAYLEFEAKKGKRSGKTRRGQRGGSMPALAGAPLDYSTRPGVYGPYGVFPAYVSSGFDFYNSINKDSLTEQCGKENITPKVPADIGSNVVSQKGGKRGRSRKTRRQRRRQRGAGFPSMSEFASAASMRPVLPNTPTSPAYDAQMAFKGQPLPPSPSPVTSEPGYKANPLATVDTVPFTYQRDLGREFMST